MKGSKRTFTESPISVVSSCIFLPDSYDMEDVDDRWKKRLRIVKFDDEMFAG